MGILLVSDESMKRLIRIRRLIVTGISADMETVRLTGGGCSLPRTPEVILCPNSRPVNAIFLGAQHALVNRRQSRTVRLSMKAASMKEV